MPIKDKWYLIGDSLEVKTGDLDSLKISNNSTDMNLSIVINKWLEEKSNEATWEALLEEVEGPIINNHQIALSSNHDSAFIDQELDLSP